MSASSSVEASSLPVPPPKPPRISARHHSVSSGASHANERMPPPVPPKRLSVNSTSLPKLSSESTLSSAASIHNMALPPLNNRDTSPILKADKPPTSPVSVHGGSKRRDSISSLLSSSSLETYLHEIKQLGRQVKRQLLEEEDIMSLGNRMLPASPQPPPAVRRNRAISLGSAKTSAHVDDLVRQQQEQLFDSFNKLRQHKQAEAHSLASDVSDSTAPAPVEKEKPHTETAPDKPIPLIDYVTPELVNEKPFIPIVYADEKRNHDFHMLFRSVPEEDRLIEEYNCAMYKDILVQGKLYISQEHLCFNAKFFGWATNLVLAYKDIKSIEKRNMALIVPNGIQITTHLDTKHVFASFMTRDCTFDLIYQTWQECLFPKKEVNEINDPLPPLPQTPNKDNHADMVNQHVVQKQAIPEETAVSNHKQPSTQQDMVYKHYQWIVMDEVFIGTVEGLYKLLYQSDFVHQYLVVMAQCQDVQFGAWDQGSNARSSTITKDGVDYQVTDTETCHQRDTVLCISSTVTSESLVDLRYKVCISRRTDTEIEAVISIHDQQYIPYFKSFQKWLSRKSTRITIQRLSEGRKLSTCWRDSKRLALQRKYVMPSVQIMKQAYLVFVLSVQSAYRYAQAMKWEHWLILLLLMASLLMLHHMNARVYLLEHQHSPCLLAFPAADTVMKDETTTNSVEMNHFEFMQLKMNEIKQKMALLHREVASQKQQLLHEPQE
ncbi:uncharacterized protein ATC70_002791 [Mucor velutinosus]|uniref:GRAM domain-containing protein n=1 Tax=Mucor velutinosus TaxID=708070 RepID=A0AAN7I052_9FUNG|nr:hypothetical protein ATC70_002791 [Mucor velutinosus]